MSFFDKQHGYFFEDITIGMQAEIQKTMSAQHIEDFARISGDDNPLHMDAAFAAHTRFKRPVVHGMLTTSLWSTLVGTRLPGPGAAYMAQALNFYKPVYAGDTVRATMQVVRTDVLKQRVFLQARAWVEGQLVAEGEAKTWVPKRSDYL